MIEAAKIKRHEKKENTNTALMWKHVVYLLNFHLFLSIKYFVYLWFLLFVLGFFF